MQMNTEEVPKPCDADADPVSTRGEAATGQEASERSSAQVRRGIGDGMLAGGDPWQHGKSRSVGRQPPEPIVREEWVGPGEMAERPAVPNGPF